MLLADSETKVDLLNNEAIAATIIKLLCSRPDQPVTIGVHGDWGAGKSSVLEMIEAGFETHAEVLCLKFNGWRFQGFEDAKIALIEGIVTGLIEKRPALTKASQAVKDIFRRIDWLKVAKKTGGLAWTLYTGIPAPDQIDSILGGLANLEDKANIESAAKELKELWKPDENKRNVPEEVGEFRKAFDQLLAAAGIRQLVVLIDDLDRCLPEVAIETLEAVRLFVFTSCTAFVVATDEAMIEYAVRKHFPDLPDSTGPRDYARNYLEKLIQVPIRIPALGETETRIYVTLLLVGVALGGNNKEYEALIKVAREQLKKPWKFSSLDQGTVRGALGDKAQLADSALVLSEQLGPILASGTRGNPRQIKRFLNTLLLRQSTAEARGFAEDVKLPVLAKLMLAERFIPRLFDQMAFAAAAHSNGVCEDISKLEAVATKSAATAESAQPSDKQKKKDGEEKGTEEAKPTESAVLGEWLSSVQILSWAKVLPRLSETDLRPYLFVTKDRKDYFGAISALGHLATIVENLLGHKLAVQGMDADLRKLSQPEAARVLEALRGRILGSDTLKTQPPGIDGLVVLIKAHPVLQPQLVDILESLPPGKLGPWVVAGWDGVIKDAESVVRFERLKTGWAASKDNPMLKTAAGGALQLPKGLK